MTSRPGAVRWHRPLRYCAALMAVLGLVSLGGLLVDDRVLVGAPIWLKPVKFSLSFGIYAATLAWMISLLPRWRRVAGVAGSVIALAATAEMAAILGQVLRGRRSHFNVATELDSALWSAMGFTIVVLWLATAVVGVALLRARLADRATAWAIRLAVPVALAGMAVGFLMVGPTPAQRAGFATADPEIIGAHSVGVPDGGPGLPILGWSTTGGDLRVPHFVGMHALQALPLLALLLTVLARRWPTLDAALRLRLVLLAAAGHGALFALLTWQALRGQALLSPDAATLRAGGALVAALAVAAVALLRRRPGRSRPPADRPAPAGPPAGAAADGASTGAAAGPVAASGSAPGAGAGSLG